MRQGEPLRLSAVRLQWLVWAVVGAVVVGLALLGSLGIDLSVFVPGSAAVHPASQSDAAPGSGR